MAASQLWMCKICFAQMYSRKSLWAHVKVKHAMHASVKALPCLYHDCVFSFRTLSSLTSHLSRHHAFGNETDKAPQCSLQCLHCGVLVASVRSYLIHLRFHVRKCETVSCPVQNCPFKTNIIGTFSSHFTKKHSVLTLDCLKEEVKSKVKCCNNVVDVESEEHDSSDANGACVNNNTGESTDTQDMSTTSSMEVTDSDVANEIAMLWVKLKTVYGIPHSAISDIFANVSRISEMSQKILYETISSQLQSYDCSANIVHEVCQTIINTLPLKTLTDSGGALSSAWKIEKYLRSKYCVVDPQECRLGCKDGKECTFVYVPFLDVLRNILRNADVLKYVLDQQASDRESFTSYRSGEIFMENQLFREQPFSLQIGFYHDDFEVANPLGTSKGKYKLSAFYWTIANLPVDLKSCVDNIQLAVLCRSCFVHHFGIENVLKKFLEDVSDLENIGVYVDALGAHLRGSISFVAADNLAAHMLFGMAQSFAPSVARFCRFCLATNRVALQDKEFGSDKWLKRTPTNYAWHLQQVNCGLADMSTYGIRHNSVFHKYLTYFHATDGFPPDVSHDLLEGIVPFELALCISRFIEKKYFRDIVEINHILDNFHYLYTDAVNKPQSISGRALAVQNIGGNATENRTLLRLLPFLFGAFVPSDDLHWKLVMLLKEIVELAFAPSMHQSDISYFQSKLDDHHSLFRELFPDYAFKPKHHFVSHYAELTKRFGPLCQFCTMRFESKHSFFKQMLNDCKNFKNVPKMLASRHQLLQCYLAASGKLFSKAGLSVSSGNCVPLSFFPKFEQLLHCRFPHVQSVLRVPHCTFNGVNYKCGLYVIDGFELGLPQFCKVEAILEHCGDVHFLCTSQNSHYVECFHSYEVENSSTCHIHSIQELADYYPLPGYCIETEGRDLSSNHNALPLKVYVTLKHFVTWRLH